MSQLPAAKLSRDTERQAPAKRGENFRLATPPRRPNGHKSDKRNNNGSDYKPGDTVRQTGIYEVIHDRDHRAPHDVVMLSGDQFPQCDTCDARVRFRLLRTAPYIFQDADFEEPEG